MGCPLFLNLLFSERSSSRCLLWVKRGLFYTSLYGRFTSESRHSEESDIPGKSLVSQSLKCLEVGEIWMIRESRHLMRDQRNNRSKAE